MRIKLKGIHAAHVTLADRTKNGEPRLCGEPGTPDFTASYNEAVAKRAPTPEGKLQFLIEKFQASGAHLVGSKGSRSYHRQSVRTWRPAL